MQGVWARDIDALGRGGGELVERSIYLAYSVFLGKFFAAFARARVYGKELKAGREFQPVDKAPDYPARTDNGQFHSFTAFLYSAPHDRAGAQGEYDIKLVLLVEIYCVGVI